MGAHGTDRKAHSMGMGNVPTIGKPFLCQQRREPLATWAPATFTKM